MSTWPSPSRHVLIVFLLLTSGALFPACRRSATPPAATGPASSPPAATAEAAPEPSATGALAPDDPEPVVTPAPDVSLTADEENPLTVYQGTPLIFTVRIANQRAANAIAMKLAHPASPARPIPTVTLPVNWPELIRLESRSSAKTTATIALGVGPFATPGGNPALDGTAVLEASCQLSVEAAAKLPTGTYRIIAILDTGRSAGWHGTASSVPLVLTVKPRPPALGAAEASLDLLRHADFYAGSGQWPLALAAARKAVALTRDSVDAQCLLGDALFASNDKRGALAAYGEALRAYRKANPDPAVAPPAHLIRRVRRTVAETVPGDAAR